MKNIWHRIPFATKYGWCVFLVTMLMFNWLDPLTIGETIFHFIFCSVIFNLYTK